jgi:hypothetical protein
MMHMLKAIVGAFGAAGASLVAAVQDTGPGGSTVTTEEIFIALGAFIVALGAVWAVPNSGPRG